jgi:hypothetical protein
MTREEAMTIRIAHLNGEPIKVLDLQEAIAVLSATSARRFRLPTLPAAIKERVNAALCFNLGRALRK